jgi:putative membrane protein
MRFPRLRRRNPMRGAVAGLIGGLAGAWTMNQFQALVSKAKENCAGTSGSSQNSQDKDDATMKAAAWVLRSVAGITPSKEQKKSAGPIVHYGFGAAMGALYGALAEYKRRVNPGHGALLGTSLFVGADEIAVPALGLSQAPTESPLSVHATALGAHLVYGLTTEAVRGRVRRALMLV